MYFEYKNRMLDRADRRQEVFFLMPIRFVLAAVIVLILWYAFGCSAPVPANSASTNVALPQGTPNIEFDFNRSRYKAKHHKWRRARTSAPATR